MGNDLTPMFQGEIDAEVLETSLEEPSSKGWVNINEWTKYHNHAVVFAHFAEGGSTQDHTLRRTEKEACTELCSK